MEGGHMKSWVVSLCAAALLVGGAGAAFAGGSNVYPNGAEGFWMGAAPPPGLYYQNYTLYYSAHKYASNSGSDIAAGPLAGFQMNAFANVSRVIYISDKSFCCANWGAHIFIPYQYFDADAAGGDATIGSLGDIIVDPFLLAWHWPNLHIVSGLDIYLPTGNYHSGRLMNTSANTVVFEPVLGLSYMTPMKGLTASVKLMYDIPGDNDDFVNPFNPAIRGDLQYGQEFHFDYSLDYAVAENWKVGVGGYFYQQTTNDELNGVDIENNRGHVWAVGPGVEWGKGNWVVSYRTQFEVDAKNRPEGIANWLRVVYIF